MVEQKYNLSIAEEMSYDEDIICFWKPYGNDKIGPHVFCQWYKTNFIDENNVLILYYFILNYIVI